MIITVLGSEGEKEVVGDPLQTSHMYLTVTMFE